MLPTRISDVIESGSHHPGVAVDAWRIPPGTAVRFERPDPALRPFITAYAVLDSHPILFHNHPSWLLGSPARIWISLNAPDLQVKPRARRTATLNAAMLIGPNSIAMPLRSSGGISIVIELTARGWGRFLDVSAASLRDQVVLLSDHWPAEWATALVAGLRPCGRGLGVKDALDRFFLDILPAPKKDEPLIVRVARIVAAGEPNQQVSDWHAMVGMGSARTLARLCEHYFGFSPKLLQRQVRFMRSLTAMMLATDPIDFGAVPAGYHDIPHFLRDARQFLGMTARQFVSEENPYLRAVMRARLAVVGSPLVTLDAPHDYERPAVP